MTNHEPLTATLLWLSLKLGCWMAGPACPLLGSSLRSFINSYVILRENVGINIGFSRFFWQSVPQETTTGRSPAAS